LTQVEFAPQVVQLKPPAPHAAGSLPETQSPVAEQQPSPQFSESHATPAVQAPPEQCAPIPCGQRVQAAPPVPHAESSSPETQSFPLQQPVGQDVESQGPLVLQALSTQVAAGPHSSHARPPVPQAPFSPPPTQVFPEQQPSQLVGPHCAGVTQVPFTHACPDLHCTQANHCAPQLVPFVPSWQTPFGSQHPAHSSGSQAVERQTPPPTVLLKGTHCSVPVGQAAHAWPPLPHALGSVPERQPASLQQPAQLLALQPTTHDEVPWGVVSQVRLPMVQSSQMAPPLPHDLSPVPVTHTGPEQHPLQSPHCPLIAQTPLAGSQTLPAEVQSPHAPPSRPQALPSRPVWQAPLASQQPPGQLHGGGVTFGTQAPMAVSQ
jgi:hypothetical protein